MEDTLGIAIFVLNREVFSSLRFENTGRSSFGG